MPSVSPHGLASCTAHRSNQLKYSTQKHSQGHLALAAGEVGKLQQEFTKRGFKIAALSCNDVESHKG